MTKMVKPPAGQPYHGPGCDVPASLVASRGRGLALLVAVVDAVAWVKSTVMNTKDHVVSN